VISGFFVKKDKDITWLFAGWLHLHSQRLGDYLRTRVVFPDLAGLSDRQGIPTRFDLVASIGDNRDISKRAKRDYTLNPSKLVENKTSTPDFQMQRSERCWSFPSRNPCYWPISRAKQLHESGTVLCASKFALGMVQNNLFPWTTVPTGQGLLGTSNEPRFWGSCKVSKNRSWESSIASTIIIFQCFDPILPRNHNKRGICACISF